MEKEKFVEIRKFIRKRIEESMLKQDLVEQDLIIEGIDIDSVNKTVKFNGSHEENVNTSILLNPTYSKIDNYDIISLFERKYNSDKSDGNPLIYALKGLYGWKIEKNDIISLLKQFIRISEKIKTEYDTIITISSSSRLNKEFLYRLNKIIKSKNKIEEFFTKIPANEVWIKYYDGHDISNIDAEKMERAFKKMIQKNNNIFSFKFIPKNLRYTIKKSVDYDPEAYQVEYGEKINGKDILVLDDTISSGATISEYCRNIIDTFTPKSITIITLFSAL